MTLFTFSFHKMYASPQYWRTVIFIFSFLFMNPICFGQSLVGASKFRIGLEKGQLSVVQPLFVSGEAKIDHLFEDGLNPILVGISSENIELLDFLVQNGADIMGSDLKGESTLHYASKLGLPKILEWLLGFSPPLDIRDKSGNTPLHFAVSSRSLDVVKLLVGAGASVQLENSKGETPLLLAIEKLDPAVIQFLILNGASVNSRNSFGLKPLDLVRRLGARGAAVLPPLILGGIDLSETDENGRTLMHEVLLWKNSNYSEQGAYIATLSNSPFLLETLDKEGLTPLDLAIVKKNESVEEVLRKMGGRTAIEINAGPPFIPDKKNVLDVVKVPSDDSEISGSQIVESPPDLPADFSGDSSMSPSQALKVAVQTGDVELVIKLLNGDVDPSQPDLVGLTPLHWAAMGGHVDLIKLLLKAGADPYAKSFRYGMEPMHHAVQSGQFDVIKELIVAKVSLDHKDQMGRTPLDLAIQQGDEAIISLFSSSKKKTKVK